MYTYIYIYMYIIIYHSPTYFCHLLPMYRRPSHPIAGLPGPASSPPGDGPLGPEAGRPFKDSMG